MTDSTAGRVPAMKTVWMEQLRVVGLAIRREGALAGVVLAIGSLVVIAVSRIPILQAIVDEGGVSEFVFDPGEPPWGFIAVLAALLLPFVVWKGERRFGDTLLWSLPVDHRKHALLKVAAGWVWLLAILGAALAWVTFTVLVSGGTLGVDDVRVLVLDPVGAAAGAPDATESVRWTTPWWEWALPFTSASAAYLLVSTLFLATARPLFWVAGLWVAGAGALGVAEIRDIGWIQRSAELVTWYAGGDSFNRGVQLPTGWIEGWMLLPSMEMWLASSAFWIGLGLVGVTAAVRRARSH